MDAASEAKKTILSEITRMNKEHEAMYNQNKVPYINEIGADVPSKGSIIDEEV